MVEKTIVAAVKKAIETAKARNFTESVELAINLKDVDLSQPKNRINEEIILPKGRGRPVKVAVFGSGEVAVLAKNVAEKVILPEEIEDIASDKRQAKKMAREHQFFVAEAPLMPVIGKRLGIILGPRGKMPRPIPPGADPAPFVQGLRNTVRVRSKDRRTFHAMVGTRTMKPEDIAVNIEEILKRVSAKLPRGSGNIESAYVKTSMGPAIRLK